MLQPPQPFFYRQRGTSVSKTTPYDGAVERLNQKREKMLQTFVDDTGKDWDTLSSVTLPFKTYPLWTTMLLTEMAKVYTSFTPVFLLSSSLLR